MSRQLENTERSQIVALLKAGYSTRQVAEILKINQSTVVRTNKKHKESGLFGHLGGNGRPFILTEPVMDVIGRENKKIGN